MNQSGGKFASVLFLILLIVFLLFFSGVPGTDDEQLFASAAQSYYVTGNFSAYQVFGNDRLQGNYAGIAPPHVWMGLVAYGLAEKLHTGGLQCFFLLSPIYSALTGYLLIRIAQMRGFSKPAILVSIFIFGFATMVLAYSRSFFREPLAMLFLTASSFEIESILQEKPNHLSHTAKMAAALLFLSLAIWTKEFLIVCVPLLAYYFFSKRKAQYSLSSRNDQRELRKIKKTFLIIFACIFICTAILFLRDSSGRFTISYLSRLFSYFPNIKHDSFLESLFRIFFSLSKGFLTYSPVLLMVLFAPLMKNVKIEKSDYLLALGSSFGVAMLQAFFYDSEWWTFTWSTRFLLPVIPLWIICLFPLVESILQHKNIWGKIFLCMIILIAFFMQLGSVLISSADYTQYLWEHFHYRLSETNISHVEAIPAIGHWLAFFNGVLSDVGWIRILSAGVVIGILFPIVLLVLGVVGLAFFIRSSKISTKTFGLLIILLCIILPFLTLISNQDDPYYGKDQIAYQQLLIMLSHSSTKDDVIAIDAYNQPLWYHYFNFGFPETGWVGLPPEQVSMFSNVAIYPEMNRTISFLLSNKKPTSKIWLVAEKKEKISKISYLSELENAGLKISSENVFFQQGQYPLVHLIEIY